MPENNHQVNRRLIVFINEPTIKKVVVGILVGSIITAVFTILTGIIKKMFSNEEEVILTVEPETKRNGIMLWILIFVILSLMATIGVQIYRNINDQNLGLHQMIELIRERVNTIWNGGGDRGI